MTTPRLTIPDVVERFRDYHDRNPVWGSLHIVLSDGNVKDDHVRFCRDWAQREGDTEGVELAEILLAMSKTQRLKLPSAVQRRGDS